MSFLPALDGDDQLVRGDWVLHHDPPLPEPTNACAVGLVLRMHADDADVVLWEDGQLQPSRRVLRETLTRYHLPGMPTSWRGLQRPVVIDHVSALVGQERMHAVLKAPGNKGFAVLLLEQLDHIWRHRDAFARAPQATAVYRAFTERAGVVQRVLRERLVAEQGRVVAKIPSNPGAKDAKAVAAVLTAVFEAETFAMASVLDDLTLDELAACFQTTVVLPVETQVQHNLSTLFAHCRDYAAVAQHIVDTHSPDFDLVDVGCGGGLFLLALAARQAGTGTALGVDLEHSPFIHMACTDEAVAMVQGLFSADGRADKFRVVRAPSAKCAMEAVQDRLALKTGDTVVFRGLTEAPDLNGLGAEVVRLLRRDAKTGQERITVRLPGGKSVKAKPKNLRRHRSAVVFVSWQDQHQPFEVGDRVRNASSGAEGVVSDDGAGGLALDMRGHTMTFDSSHRWKHTPFLQGDAVRRATSTATQPDLKGWAGTALRTAGSRSLLANLYEPETAPGTVRRMRSMPMDGANTAQDWEVRGPDGRWTPAQDKRVEPMVDLLRAVQESVARSRVEFETLRLAVVGELVPLDVPIHTEDVATGDGLPLTRRVLSGLPAVEELFRSLPNHAPGTNEVLRGWDLADQTVLARALKRASCEGTCAADNKTLHDVILRVLAEAAADVSRKKHAGTLDDAAWAATKIKLRTEYRQQLNSLAVQEEMVDSFVEAGMAALRTRAAK